MLMTTINTPKLRFPEFKNSGDWVEVKLCEILSYERPDKYIIKGSIENTGNIPVLTANKSFILGYTNETVGICKNYPVILFDDFTTDKKYVDFDFKIKSSAIKLLHAKPNNNLKYIYELMQTIKFNPQEHKRYYISYYQNLPVNIPILKEEQTKIANCFSSLDKLIGLEKEKLNKLQEHKKGLMSNLFPNNNEKQPKLRFPEFKNSGDWKNNKLSEIVTFYNNLRKPVAKHLRVSGEYPYYGANGIIDYIDNYIFDGLYILIGEDGSVINVDKTPIVNLVNGKFWVNNHAHIINGISNITNTLFIFYALQRVNIEYLVKGVPPKLNKVSAESIIIKYPNIKEQTKIANFLSSLDIEIDNQKLKIEKLEEHKKGLLQKLFI